jgi:1-acyl-sn-glycerol-3-phosphate acyltransferase
VIKPLQAFRYKYLKAVCFIVFGAGSLVLAFLIFPALRLSISDRQKFRRRLRSAVSRNFRWFIQMMGFMNVVKVKISSRQTLAQAGNVVMVANHPSLLDVVILIAFVPNADCIVKAGLWRNPIVNRVISRVYIPNSLGFDATLARCAASFDEGNALIIFPQGTRIINNLDNKLQRGSAQIALRTGRDILPVKIAVDDAAGLRKGDSLTHFPQSYCHNYSLDIGEPIRVAPFRDEEPGKAARALTRLIEAAIVKP